MRRAEFERQLRTDMSAHCRIHNIERPLLCVSGKDDEAVGLLQQAHDGTFADSDAVIAELLLSAVDQASSGPVMKAVTSAE